MTIMSLLWPTLLLLGDSLTQYSFSKAGGWGGMLANSLTRRCDVTPRGFSGYNTRQWVTLSKELSFRGDMATLWLGANDASNTEKQGVPISEYKLNLITIVQNLKTVHGIKDLIMMTPPPSDEHSMPEHMKVGRSGALTEKYAEACKEVAETLGLPCVDVHTAFKQQKNWQSLLSDGLHLSEEGSELVHDLTLPFVNAKLQTHMPRDMKDELILPLWSEAENSNPCPEVIDWIKNHPVSTDSHSNAQSNDFGMAMRGNILTRINAAICDFSTLFLIFWTVFIWTLSKYCRHKNLSRKFPLCYNYK